MVSHHIRREWYLQWVSFNFPFSWREIISGNDVFPLSDSQIHFLFQTQMQELQMFRKSFSFFFCQKNHCMLQIILVEDGIWVNSVSYIERPILQTYQFLLCFYPQFEDGYCFSLSDIVRSNHIWRPIHFFAFILWMAFLFHWQTLKAQNILKTDRDQSKSNIWTIYL